MHWARDPQLQDSTPVLIDRSVEVVAGIVLKRMGANTRAAIEGVKDRLPAIQQALPDGVSIEPFYDQAELAIVAP